MPVHVDAISTRDVEAFLRAVYPSYEFQDFGSSDVEYVVANVREAVIDDILLLLSDRLATLEEAARMRKFRKDIPSRDWQVAESHLLELISEIRQYKTKGIHGNQTGSVEVILPTEEENG